MIKLSRLLFVTSVALMACTTASLSTITKTDPDTVALQGDLCTSRPQKLKSPIKILFVVDSSASLLYNDPTNLHVTAMQETVQRFRGVSNVTFAVLRFGQHGADQGVVRENLLSGGKDLFSNDPNEIDPIFARMRQPPAVNQNRYLGGTDYALGLNAANQYIQEDVATHPPVGLDYQYFVEFITDGMPQSDNSNPVSGRASIMTAVKNLAGAYTNLRFDMYAIYQVEIVPPEFVNILPDMAKLANGTLTQVDDPQQLSAKLSKMLSVSITYAEMGVARLAMAQDLQSVLVANLNARIAQVNGIIDSYKDSDGDGLVDLYEIAKGYNETSTDSDGDGLDDFFEDKLSPVFDPLAAQSPALTPMELADVDHDGLNTVEEARLQTDANRPDTDGDGVADGMEFIAGTDPTVADLNADYDGDGTPNGFELMQHTDPNLAEPARLRHLRAYRTGAIGMPSQTGDGRWCYTFEVKNITLHETVAAVDADHVTWPSGGNRLLLRFVERALPVTVDVNKSGVTPQARRGQTFVLYRPSVPMRDPSALELTLQNTEFDPP